MPPDRYTIAITGLPPMSRYTVMTLRGGYFRLACALPMPESVAEDTARRIPGAWIVAVNAEERATDSYRRKRAALMGLSRLSR